MKRFQLVFACVSALVSIANPTMGQPPSRALEIHLSAAEKGDVKAQNALGEAYFKGEGAPRSPPEAMKWFQKAADQNYAFAQHNLAVAYFAASDPAQAAHWYRRAAEQGLAASQTSLGTIYSSGLGVRQDIDEAVRWWRKAAEQNWAAAQYLLGLAYNEGHGLSEDPAMAFGWLTKAAQQGHSESLYWLGRLHASGRGTPSNPAEAVKLWHAAAEKGVSLAKLYLGYAYAGGLGVSVDYAQAFTWFQRAAEHNLGEAQWQLAQAYFNGRGVEKDGALGLTWTRKAAGNGVPRAQYLMGIAYQADTADRDPIQAFVFFSLAARNGEKEASTALAKLQETLTAGQRTEALRLLEAAAPGQRPTAAPPTSASARIDLAKRWTESELRALLVGRSPNQVQDLLGRPDGATPMNRETKGSSWRYDRVLTRDPANRVDASGIIIWFSEEKATLLTLLKPTVNTGDVPAAKASAAR